MQELCKVREGLATRRLGEVASRMGNVTREAEWPMTRTPSRWLESRVQRLR